MVDSVLQLKAGEAQALFPANFVETQERNANMFARANEAMVKTAQPIWESQTEFLRRESEQLAKAFTPPKLNGDPSAAISTYCDLWRENSERLITQIRTVSDLTRECGWQLFHIYADGLRRNVKPLQPQ